MTAIRIAAVSGSLRASSINTALLRTIASGAPEGVTVELVSLGALPLFNPIWRRICPKPSRSCAQRLLPRTG
ncbi:NADPH-dependent FMN reductase [Sphingomonas glacialis]|uniref:NADPH-dependent FMN reductase n=1 Tax=Sphingomonas glacialis TaxID=658225 RepID=UPI001673449A|nr:NAD(P)H-dependent oxidoreductase [Sphingomonas glacialis]